MGIFDRGARERPKIAQYFLIYPKIQYLAIFNLFKKISIKISYKEIEKSFYKFLNIPKNVKNDKK